MEADKDKILVVDDEEDLCEILQFNLEGDGYEVDVAYSAEDALKLDLTQYSLFLLDVMMGNMSGYKLAEKIRKDLNILTPFIFVTAKNTENDLLTGFNIGSDDYITKPFSIKEVLVRVKAVIRRPVREDEAGYTKKYVFEDMVLDADLRSLSIKKKSIKLTRKEFEILLLLIKNNNRFFSREEILSKVWSDDVVVSDRTVDVHITRLRKKLGNYGKHLIGRSGFGYGMQFED